MESILEADAALNEQCASEAPSAKTHTECYKQEDILLFEEQNPYKLFISDIIY
jgi:hypothetical protein